MGVPHLFRNIVKGWKRIRVVTWRSRAARGNSILGRGSVAASIQIAERRLEAMGKSKKWARACNRIHLLWRCGLSREEWLKHRSRRKKSPEIVQKASSERNSPGNVGKDFRLVPTHYYESFKELAECIPSLMEHFHNT